MRQTIGVDFDGTLHSYHSGWQGEGVVADPPVPGAIEWLNAITGTYNVAIDSVRSGTVKGRTAMENWLVASGATPEAMGRVSMPTSKPQALLYVDDRGWRFDGTNFPTAADVEAAVPWWKADA